MKKLVYILLATLLLAACSTTKHLPEGEVLYTGQKPMIVENRSDTKVGETAMEEVEAALAKAPNNSLLGSSEYRIPFHSDCGCIMVLRSTKKVLVSGYSIALPPPPCSYLPLIRTSSRK